MARAHLHQLLLKMKRSSLVFLPREYVQANEREGTIERRQDLFGNVIRRVQSKAGILEHFMGSGDKEGNITVMSINLLSNYNLGQNC